eukprot:4586914-Alexandrium_andersonii.AAC.1
MARGRPLFVAVDNQSVLRAIHAACLAAPSPRLRPWQLQVNGDLLALLSMAVRRLGSTRVRALAVKAHAEAADLAD